MSSDGIVRTAIITDDGLYRPLLTQTWEPNLPWIGWGALNPSKADAYKDDPSVRRMRAFSRAWGYGGFRLVNLHDWRATDPRELKRGQETRSDQWARLFYETATAGPFVLAWGANAGEEGFQIARMIAAQNRLFPLLCLGTTKEGHPRHPLYVRADTEPVPWLVASPKEGADGAN